MPNPTRRLARLALLGSAFTLLGSACAPRSTGPDRLAVRDSISIVSPRCANVRSCLLGHVTSARDAAPVFEAVVFLERETARPDDEPVRIQTRTDEQGVFTVADPPPGSYRIKVYKEANAVEVIGVELGRPGTTMLPVRLALE